MPLWWDKLIGAAEVPGKVVDIAGESAKALATGLDMLHLSNEEKTLADAAAWKLYLEQAKITLSASGIKSKARRDIAISTARVFFFFLIASAVVWPFNAAYSDRLFEYAKVMAPYFGVVMAFFFGPYMYRTYIKKEK